MNSFAAAYAPGEPARVLEKQVRALFPPGYAAPGSVTALPDAALAGRKSWRDGKARLVGRVRIDNGPELRTALGRKAGEDAELVLAAWERWGAACPAHLVGDFAFVLWDEAQRVLLAARDGLGMATLCYCRTGGRLLLAGDLEQLLPETERKPDLLSLAGWLSGWPDPHRSLFQGIEVLPPGHALVADEKGVRTQRFWQVPPGRRLRYRQTDEYAEHLSQLLSRAVADRLRTPAPLVASQMSGGLDSTTVTALAAAAGKRELLVISHAYGETAACDEQPLIDAMREHLGLSRCVTLPAERFLSLDYPALYPPATESPGTVLSPRYREEVALLAQAGARVLLTGSGGDEVTWGHALNYLQRLKRGELGVVAEVVRGCREQGLPLAGTLRGLFLAPLMPAWLQQARGRAADRLPPWIPTAARRRLELERRLLEPSPAGFADPAREARFQALHRTATYNAVRSWERVAREFDVAVRHPFFDTRLVEFSFAVPDHLWNREGYPKWLLRRAMNGRLPESVCWNRKKVVFDDFFIRVIRRHPEQVRKLLSHPWLEEQGLLDRKALLTAYDETIAGKRPFNVDLLYALMTQVWVGNAVEGSLASL